MMPYPSYQLYQAERSPSAAERRQVEMQLGRAAAGTSELRGRAARMARAAGRGLGQLGTWPHRAAPRAAATRRGGDRRPEQGQALT